MRKKKAHPKVPRGMVDVAKNVKLSWSRMGRVDDSQDYVHMLNLDERFEFRGLSVTVRIGDVGPMGIRVIHDEYRALYNIDMFGQPGIKIVRPLNLGKKIEKEARKRSDAIWGK
jgi:hypothetical protein